MTTTANECTTWCDGHDGYEGVTCSTPYEYVELSCYHRIDDDGVTRDELAVARQVTDQGQVIVLENPEAAPLRLTVDEARQLADHLTALVGLNARGA